MQKELHQDPEQGNNENRETYEVEQVPFSQIANNLIDDSNLSAIAFKIWVLVYRMHPEQRKHLKTGNLHFKMKEGRDAVAKAIKELQIAGYATKRVKKNAQGKCIGCHWSFTSTPNKNRITDIQGYGKPVIQKNNTVTKLIKNKQKDSGNTCEVQKIRKSKRKKQIRTQEKQEKAKALKKENQEKADQARKEAFNALTGGETETLRKELETSPEPFKTIIPYIDRLYQRNGSEGLKQEIDRLWSRMARQKSQLII